MDCFINIYQFCLKPFPWVYGIKMRMTDSSPFALAHLSLHTTLQGAADSIGSKAPRRGSHALADRKRKWRANERKEKEEIFEKENKEKEKQSLKALMSSAGKGLLAFVFRIRGEVSPQPHSVWKATQSEGLKPDQSFSHLNL